MKVWIMTNEKTVTLTATQKWMCWLEVLTSQTIFCCNQFKLMLQLCDVIDLLSSEDDLNNS